MATVELPPPPLLLWIAALTYGGVCCGLKCVGHGTWCVGCVVNESIRRIEQQSWYWGGGGMLLVCLV